MCSLLEPKESHSLPAAASVTNYWFIHASSSRQPTQRNIVLVACNLDDQFRCCWKRFTELEIFSAERKPAFVSSKGGLSCQLLEWVYCCDVILSSLLLLVGFMILTKYLCSMARSVFVEEKAHVGWLQFSVLVWAVKFVSHCKSWLLLISPTVAEDWSRNLRTGRPIPLLLVSRNSRFSLRERKPAFLLKGGLSCCQVLEGVLLFLQTWGDVVSSLLLLQVGFTILTKFVLNGEECSCGSEAHVDAWSFQFLYEPLNSSPIVNLGWFRSKAESSVISILVTS